MMAMRTKLEAIANVTVIVVALGVNTSDHIVGGYEGTSGRFHAFLRTP